MVSFSSAQKDGTDLNTVFQKLEILGRDHTTAPPGRREEESALKRNTVKVMAMRTQRNRVQAVGWGTCLLGLL